MKIECSVENLKEAAQTANRFISRQTNLPILKTILLSAHDRELVVRATNLECGVEIVVPAKVDDGGVCAVPGDVLSGFLNNLGSEKSITLKKDGDTLNLQSQKAKAQVRTLQHDEFPILPTVSAENSFKVRASDFANLIHSVSFCAATGGVKPELQSVMIYGEGSKMYAVATDSFRLAERAIAVKGLTSLPQLLIPLRNGAELARLLDGSSEEIEVYYNENQLATRAGDTYYTTRLIDGTFPNYRSIIPKASVSEAAVLREDLSQALKLLAVFADKFAQVVITLSPAKKSMTLAARNAEVGENTVVLKGTLSGEEIHMTFNGRYLADSLQSIEGESLRFAFSGPGKPLVISPLSSGGSFVYIVMPMNR